MLDPSEKLEIARLLDELGIDRIEAGFPRVSADDWDAVKLISAAGLRAEIWGFSRAVPADLEALVELGVRFSVIESPISDLKLTAIGVSREKMLDRITSAMRFAAEHGIHAAFFGVDSTRAEPDFYRQVYSSAIEAGAKEVVVVDTLGIASPEAVGELVASTVELAGPDVPVHFHGHNDFGVATGERGRRRPRRRLLRPGDDQRDGRAGREREPRRGGARRSARSTASSRTSGSTGSAPSPSGCASSRATQLEPWKPVTGETLFRRESGAVASQFHDPPVDRAVLVGARRAPSARSCSARRAALDSIRIKAEELGLDVAEERVRRAARRGQGARHAQARVLSPTRSSSSSSPERRVIERVCVAGAGVIGSLFAGHLAQVADVSVLDAARGARAGAERRGPARLGPVRPPRLAHRRRPILPRCPSRTSCWSAARGPTSRRSRPASAATSPGRR